MTRNLTKQFPSGAVAKRRATAKTVFKKVHGIVYSSFGAHPSRRPDRKIIQKPRTAKLSPRKSRPDVAVQRPKTPIGPTRSRTSDLHISAAFLNPRQEYEGMRIRTAYPRLSGNRLQEAGTPACHLSCTAPSTGSRLPPANTPPFRPEDVRTNDPQVSPAISRRKIFRTAATSHTTASSR